MAQRAGVTFELERLDLEGDELVVSGHWSGVRGLRFVRPTLVADDRRILATLEHKPWAPSLDRTWTAAFPWNGDDVDVDALVLDVAPQVAVALGEARVVAVPPPPATVIARRAAEKSESPPRRRLVVAEPEPLPPTPVPAASAQPAPPLPVPAASAQPEPVPTPVRSVRPAAPEPIPAPPAAQPHAALEDELDELARSRAAAERDRDRALAQLDEAVAAREAAVRSRARMELAHDEALQARASAAARLAASQAQRDEANAQRDEVLLAYRALQRHVQAERAHEDREQTAKAHSAGDEPAGTEVPIGVRTMPAARTVMAALQQRPTSIRTLPVSQIDLWVIRVLAIVAGGCFLMLLISILRVLI